MRNNVFTPINDKFLFYFLIPMKDNFCSVFSLYVANKNKFESTFRINYFAIYFTVSSTSCKTKNVSFFTSHKRKIEN